MYHSITFLLQLITYCTYYNAYTGYTWWLDISKTVNKLKMDE